MSQRDADSFISKNEREFILKALGEDVRLDGRRPNDIRKPKFQFSLDDRSATVAQGSTRVMAVVSAALEAPYPDRPSEGPLRFNVEFSPMASPAFEPGKPGEDAIQVARLIERGLRQSGAVDQEALCVVAGRKVWALRVDCHVLDHGGNLLDVSFLAALAALLAFRKPEVEVGGESGSEIIVHPPEVREPVPLTIHHLPVAVTFALFQAGDVLVADPTWKEEAAAAGSCTVVMNPAQEVCCVHKADGIGLSPEQFMRCVRLAGRQAEEVVAGLKKALEGHEVARVQARVRRHQQVPGLPAEGRHVMILGAKDPAGGAAPAPAAASGTAPAAAAKKPTAAADDVDEDADIDDGTDEEEEAEREKAEDAAAAAGTGPAGSSGRGAKAAQAGEDEDENMDDAGAVGKQQGGQKPKAKLAGPLVKPAGGKAGGKAAGTSPGAGSKRGGGATGGLQANKRGKDNVGFDELEAIAAVIAGVPPGGPAPGEPEPSLAAAVKPGKGRKGGGK
ncbi:hypothetical protein HXX76_002810 [Chlamydomonas incerta]|uniref:Exosome complex component RRP45 n=1 Tax=Chlamydomonas incerta TaxID=51695 RepID=A0A835TFX8_CHLIN|nr:hypothetical protein HXX76_002810 [Chlamydomonas incerta]|eukprot:KAG2442728.1 hypothetical protein HXX76_002810 [Chlamydomonas incerta]